MARVKTNVIVEGLSGKLGNQLVFRHLRDGQTVVCVKPDFSKRVLSKDQKAHHARFQAAAAYAHEASISQPIYAQLAAGTMKNAYNLALGDWFHPPVIHSIEKRGGKVLVQASDDVCVASLRVMMVDDNGSVLEEGDAVQLGGDWWEYETTAAGNAIAEARDLAGNVVRMEMEAGE
ncbi:MAG: hypothetical protein WBW94_09055 [Anaerolineales bacterium]